MRFGCKPPLVLPTGPKRPREGQGVGIYEVKKLHDNYKLKIRCLVLSQVIRW